FNVHISSLSRRLDTMVAEDAVASEPSSRVETTAARMAPPLGGLPSLSSMRRGASMTPVVRTTNEFTPRNVEVQPETAVVPAALTVRDAPTVNAQLSKSASLSSLHSFSSMPAPRSEAPASVPPVSSSAVVVRSLRSADMQQTPEAAGETPRQETRPAARALRSLRASFGRVSMQAWRLDQLPGESLASPRRIRLQQRLTLCLNRPVGKGGLSAWETAFQHEMAPSWWRFFRISIIMVMIVLCSFTLLDWWKYGRTDRDDMLKVWADLSIVRFAVMMPILIFTLLLTLSERVKGRWLYTQAGTAFAMLSIGVCLIALSVVGKDPGYGVLALYIVYCANFSLQALLLRFIIPALLVIAYVILTLVFNGNVVSKADTWVTALYLSVFFLGQLSIVAQREAAVRQNFFRRFRIAIERRKLSEEQAKTTRLLENLLPPVIVTTLRADARKLIADTHDDVTILWTDMKGFTNFSSSRTPIEIVTFLNAMFSTFDRILDKYGVRKIEVLGDAFFCCAGVPTATPDHAERCANAALEMLMHMPVLRSFAGADINMRIGIHTGSVVAGVVGTKDLRYHLFGDSVPMANAMESHGIPGAVQLSASAYERLASRQRERARAFVEYVSSLPPAHVDLRSAGAHPTLAYAPAQGSSLLPEQPPSSSNEYPAVFMPLLDEFIRQATAPFDSVMTDVGGITPTAANATVTDAVQGGASTCMPATPLASPTSGGGGGGGGGG
ncbi:hypothetical protein EON62_02150, partial [archaeon]